MNYLLPGFSKQWYQPLRSALGKLLAVLLLSMCCNQVLQAAPSYQAVGTAVSGTGAVSPAWPAHAVNDLALLFVESAGGQAATLSTPAGFVAVDGSPQSTGTGTTGARLTVFWARANSTSMPAPTIQDPGDHVYAQIITYRNVSRTGNPWDVTGGGTNTPASASVTLTGVITTLADTLVVQAAARDNDSTAAAFSALTNTNLADITKRSDAGTTSGNGGGFAVWDGAMAGAGATGSTTATVSNSVNAFLTIALKPDIFELTQVASTSSVPINTNFTLTFTARNPVNGSSQPGVAITDNLTSAGLTFVAFNPAVGTFTFTGGVLTWNVGTVAAGTSATATLTINAATAGAKTNTITSNVGTPAATAAVTVQAYAPLADWRMDEPPWTGAANEVKDNSGGGFHGRSRIANGSTSVATTATGLPAYTNGTQNTCRYGEFDKTSSPARTFSYVELSGLPVLGSSFTFAAWIKSANPSQSGQRILVRDDAQNGWGFSLGDPGAAKVRFFNRNITNSGAVTGDGSNPSCGVFCLDTAAVITANAWFFVAVAIDTTGKTVTHYVYNAAGTLVSNTSSGFAGTWVDGTGTASIGGETSASSEGTQASFHFQGNVDEMQIYSGVLSELDLNVLRTRSRTCGVTVDHYELSVPTNSLTCTTSTVKVTACADSSSPCTNAVTTINGQTATLSSAGATLGSSVVTFNASGVATTSLIYPSAADGATVSIALSAEQATATNPRKCCPDGVACVVANSCSTTFKSAGFIVTNAVNAASYIVPTQTAGTTSTSSTGKLYLRAVKTNTTTKACEAALSGTTSIDWALQCNNPTTCSSGNLMSLSAANSTTAGSSPILGNASGSTASTTSVSMTFDADGNAPFSFNYADVGQVTLFASKAAGGALVSSLTGSSNAFVVKPGGFTVSNIQQTANPNLNNPAATNASGNKFVTAGESFSATITAQSSGGATTPNFGRETTPEGVLLTHALVAPSGGSSGTLSNGTVPGSSFSNGVATVTTLNWDQVGIISLTPSVASADYLGVGNVTGTNVGHVGRFYPHHFGIAGSVVTRSDIQSTEAQATPFTYMGEPMKLTLAVTAYGKLNESTGLANYTGSFAKLDATALGTATAKWTCTSGAPCMGLAAVSGSDLSARLAIDISSPGSATPTNTTTASGITPGWVGGTSFFKFNAVFNRNAAGTPDGPYSALQIGAKPLDLDGVTVPPKASSDTAHCSDLDLTAGAINSACTFAAAEAQLRRKLFATDVRFGRLRLSNAYGSERVNLQIPVQAQYWSGASWVVNINDTGTSGTVVPVNAVTLSGYTGTLTSGNLPATSVACVSTPTNYCSGGNIKIVAGLSLIQLNHPTVTAPASVGSVKLCADLGSDPAGGVVCAATSAFLSYLKGRWQPGTDYRNDPIVTATFGIYSPESLKTIHIRESFN